MILFRQNTVLNDFVNFLKARGRFRDIEFIENSVHATPRIPGFPMIIFYIEETQGDPKDLHYVLEIHGTESSVMNREIREFFSLNKLSERKIRAKFHLKANSGEELTVEIEGIGSSFEEFAEKLRNVTDLIHVASSHANDSDGLEASQAVNAYNIFKKKYGK